jgi:hypothetical protein
MNEYSFIFATASKFKVYPAAEPKIAPNYNTKT